MDPAPPVIGYGGIFFVFLLGTHIDIRASLLYVGLGFCLVEAGWVEDSTFIENTMQAHRR